MYSGTFDAYKKISQTEGVRGLYRGFWISCFQVNKENFFKKFWTKQKTILMTIDVSLSSLNLFSVSGGIRNILRVHIRGSPTYS